MYIPYLCQNDYNIKSQTVYYYVHINGIPVQLKLHQVIYNNDKIRYL
jgi:hypothetical protein